jgi:hypothetical protein
LITEMLERLRDAQNGHDLDAFVACFDPEYRSEQPVHPDRAFVGSEQVRTNWAEVFAAVPDFQAKLPRSAEEGDGRVPLVVEKRTGVAPGGHVMRRS